MRLYALYKHVGFFSTPFCKKLVVPIKFQSNREELSLVPGAEEERLVHTDALPVN